MIDNHYNINREYIEDYLKSNCLEQSENATILLAKDFSKWEKNEVLSLPDGWADFRDRYSLDWDEVLEMFVEEKLHIQPKYECTNPSLDFSYDFVMQFYFSPIKAFCNLNFQDIIDELEILSKNPPNRLKSLCILIKNKEGTLDSITFPTRRNIHKNKLYLIDYKRIETILDNHVCVLKKKIQYDNDNYVSACKRGYQVYRDCISTRIFQV